MKISIREYNDNDFPQVFNLVHSTIDAVYYKYYPEEGVRFFHKHHSRDNMIMDIPKGTTLVAEQDGRIIGTGSIVEREIKRMFVAPDEQAKGCGKKLLAELENIAAEKNFYTAELDASLCSYDFYRLSGYSMLEYKMRETAGNNFLCYFRMIKNLISKKLFQFSYDNKFFSPVLNSDAGEINSGTIFHYHQRDDIVWAEYSGGEIERGFLLGRSGSNGELRSSYFHINIKKELRTGKSLSQPKALDDGRIILKEKWQWLDGGKSGGQSTLEEIKHRSKKIN